MFLITVDKDILDYLVCRKAVVSSTSRYRGAAVRRRYTGNKRMTLNSGDNRTVTREGPGKADDGSLTEVTETFEINQNVKRKEAPI